MYVLFFRFVLSLYRKCSIQSVISEIRLCTFIRFIRMYVVFLAFFSYNIFFVYSEVRVVSDWIQCFYTFLPTYLKLDLEIFTENHFFLNLITFFEYLIFFVK